MMASDLLKDISIILNQLSPTQNSFILDEECLNNYGPGGKQNFVRIPKIIRSQWLREKIISPDDTKTYCNENIASELLSNLNYVKIIIDSAINIFGVEYENQKRFSSESFRLMKFAVKNAVVELMSFFCMKNESAEHCCQVISDCEIDIQLNNLVTNETFKSVSFDKKSEILEIMMSNFKDFMKARSLNSLSDLAYHDRREL